MSDLLALRTLDGEFVLAHLLTMSQEETTVAEWPGGKSNVRMEGSELRPTGGFDGLDLGSGPVVFDLPPHLLGSKELVL